MKRLKKRSKRAGSPIGAVLVQYDNIIGRGHNRQMQENSPVAHEVINCLQSAGFISDYSQTILYSTLTACYLCAGAIIQLGFRKL